MHQHRSSPGASVPADLPRTPVRDSQSTTTRAAFEASFAPFDLAGLGWARAARSAPVDLLSEHPAAIPARVVRVDRGRMLLVAAGDATLRHVRDRSAPTGDDVLDPAVVGDWMLIEPPELGADGYGFARARLPRDGVLARRRVDGVSAPQALAANLDLVLVAEALDPDRSINTARIGRFVAIAAAGGIEVVVLLTGADRLEDGDDRASFADLPDEIAGAPTIVTSIVDGRGIEEVRDLLGPGTTATIVGASGAGKSSIANALIGEPLLAVGDRRATGTGRHTTSVSRLVPLPHGALLVDTPGIRSVGMHADVDTAALESTAISELAARCRFRDCHHDGEPGCAVDASIEAGDLPAHAVSEWRKLERETRRAQARVDERVRRELSAEFMTKARGYTKARRRGEYPERR
ncbi:MAG: GTPase EngC [Thermoleophilia bacterium]|nr:GTPase EngC [Thermoleophilia bacterium]